jgi:hypothetical protein
MVPTIGFQGTPEDFAVESGQSLRATKRERAYRPGTLTFERYVAEVYFRGIMIRIGGDKGNRCREP